MHLPRIQTVISEILSAHWMTQTDAKSYFYQFEMHPSIRPFFGAHLGRARGTYSSVQFTSMPMGWSWAPAIAQRVSNRLVRGLGLAWVDNFFIYANTKEDLERRCSEFRSRAISTRLALDDMTLAPTQKAHVLGMEINLTEF